MATAGVTTGTGYDLGAIRAHFVALDRGTVFFDGPAGTQVPAECSRAVAEYLSLSNSNSTHGAPFRGTAQSRATNELIDEIHALAAALVGGRAAECVFGPNMTTLAFAMSRRIGASLAAGDEVLISPIDHDANVAPWLLLAEERGLAVRWMDPVLPDAALDPAAVARAMGPRTRVVALGLASNAVGTLIPSEAVAEIAAAAHRRGAIVAIDAVHAAPHVPIDVAALDVDVLFWSAYKIYGPHLGVCWTRGELLDRLPAHNVRWRDGGVHRVETGTPAYELFAGLRGTFEYLRALGRSADPSQAGTARAELTAALRAIRAHELALARRLLERLAEIRGCRVYGIADPARAEERCPTVAFTLATLPPERVADACGQRGFAVWSGEFASFELMRRLGLAERGGAVRVGIAHYTTADEVDALADLIAGLAGGAS